MWEGLFASLKAERQRLVRVLSGRCGEERTGVKLVVKQIDKKVKYKYIESGR